MDQPAIETKLAAARTKLILDKPFLGALVLRLPLVTADKKWCPTTATDARGFYFNPEYIQGLTLAQTQFMLAHEALHCALSHFARRGHRIRHRWDLACDFAINPLLVDEDLAPPPDAVVLDQFKGMTAEEIYPLIEDKDEHQTLDQHVYDAESDGEGQSGGASDSPPRPDKSHGDGRGDGAPRPDGDASSDNQQPEARQDDSGQGKAERGKDADSGDTPAARPSPLTPDERETLSIQWQQRMAGAAQQALQAGKFGGSLARLIDHLLQPQIPWRMVLARFLTSMARDDFSYMRPSRREGDAILPSLRSTQIDLAVAVDTSGSIKGEEIDEFLAEINAIKGQIRARITLLPCDASLAEGAPWLYEPWEEFKIPAHIHGGGGTDFRPVFEWLDRNGAQPDLLVYFSDAEGEFPRLPPPYPVLWLIKGKEKVPWGERAQLN